MGADKGVDDGRGAGSLAQAARSIRVLNRMDAETAAASGIGERARLGYIRLDAGDKANLTAPAERVAWRHIAGVFMGNATTDRDGDWVGVVEPWTLPTPAEAVAENLTPERIADLHRRLTDGAPSMRFQQAGDGWAGHTLAGVLGWDVDTSTKRLGKMLDELIRAGVLTVADSSTGHRKVKIIVPGEAF